MGLVVLAALSGIIKAADYGGPGISVLSVGFIVLKAIAFLVLSTWIGSLLLPPVFPLASKLECPGMLLTTSLCFSFLLAYLANLIDLAPLVGALRPV